MPEKQVTLSKQDLALIDLGIKILEKNKIKNLKDIENIKDLDFDLEQGVRVPKGDIVAFTPVAEAALAVAVAAVMVYKAYKTGMLRKTAVLSEKVLSSVKFANDISLEKLIQVRGEIAAKM